MSILKNQYDLDSLFFEKLVWLTVTEAAIYLRKFRRRDGKPSCGAIYNLIYRGKLRARKQFGSVYLNKKEIDRAISAAII